MVRRLEVPRFPEWDEFVREHPLGTLFHLSSWLEPVGTPEIHVVEDAQGIAGGVALVKRRRFGIHGYHVIPHTPYGGPLIRPSRKQGRSSIASEESEVADELLRAIPETGHIDMLLAPGEQDLMPFFRHGYQLTVRYTHVLDTNEPDFLANMSKTNRNYLRRLKSMLTDGEISVTEDHDFDASFPLLKDVMDLKGFSSDLGLLKRRLDSIGLERWGLIRIAPAGGETLTALLYLRDWRRVYYLASGTRRTEGVLNNASLLGFDRLREIAGTDGLVLDLEGSVLPGVEEFYRKLGGKKVPLYRAEKSSSPVYHLMRTARRWKIETGRQS